MKKCIKCDEYKDLTNFYKHKTSKDGYRGECKECKKNNFNVYYSNNKDKFIEKSKKWREKNREYTKEYNKKYQENNKEILKEKSKEWRENNKEKIKEIQEKYYIENRELLINKSKEWRENNKERKKQTDKQWREKNKEKKNKNSIDWNLNNKEKRKEISKRYYKNNKEKCLEARRKWFKEKLENDDLLKCITKIRRLISNIYRNKKYSKKSRTFEILGCSYEYFIIYIENQFESWMNWKNHGIYTGNYNETWQLDHIIPISHAKNEEDIITLNHYTNFQPLCSRKNLEKSDNY